MSSKFSYLFLILLTNFQRCQYTIEAILFIRKISDEHVFHIDITQSKVANIFTLTVSFTILLTHDVLIEHESSLNKPYILMVINIKIKI